MVGHGLDVSWVVTATGSAVTLLPGSSIMTMFRRDRHYDRLRRDQALTAQGTLRPIPTPTDIVVGPPLTDIAAAYSHNLPRAVVAGHGRDVA